MLSNALAPAVLILFGGLCAGGGAFWAAYRQLKSGAENKTLVQENRDLAKKAAENGPEILALVRDIAAHYPGNESQLNDLIAMRTRALEIDRRAGEDVLTRVLAELPQTKEDFRRRTDEIAQRNQLRANEFAASWGPFVQFAIGRFDATAAQLGKTRPVTVTKVDRFEYAITGGRQDQVYLRTLVTGAYSIVLWYLPAVFTDRESAQSELALDVRGPDMRPVQVWIVDMGGPGLQGLAAPANGKPPRELTDDYLSGLGRAIQESLIRQK